MQGLFPEQSAKRRIRGMRPAKVSIQAASLNQQKKWQYFASLDPERTAFQSGDEWYEIKQPGKPWLLGWGLTGFAGI